MCLFVQATAFECLDMGPSFLACWYILTISKFEFHGHWVKYKVMKEIFCLLGTKFFCYDHGMVFKVKISLRSRSILSQIDSVWSSIMAMKQKQVAKEDMIMLSIHDHVVHET